MPRALRHAAGPVLAVLLAGCSLLPAQAPPSGADAAEARRAALPAWQFKGRVTTEDQRASLRWRQEQDRFDLLLRGPFGFGGVRVIGTPLQVEINDGEEVFVSDDPVADLYRRTGLVVPLQALRYWALGLPAPQVPARIERNLAGYISSIEQAGWQVQLDDYQALDGLIFPHQIVLLRDEQQFAISVSQWKLL